MRVALIIATVFVVVIARPQNEKDVFTAATVETEVNALGIISKGVSTGEAIEEINPDLSLQSRIYGGQALIGIDASFAGGEVSQGKSKVIDIGGPAGENVVIKTVIKQGPPIVTRHFYVHEAPKESQNTRVEEKVVEVRPRLTYKIIFIKAPSQEGFLGGSKAAIFPQNVEKTIVYILTKKSDGSIADGDLPIPPAPIVSEPEVFFIKYKTTSEADSTVSKIQESFLEGGAGYNSAGSFSENADTSSGFATDYASAFDSADGSASALDGASETNQSGSANNIEEVDQLE